MNSKHEGDIAEAFARAVFLDKGYVVLQPVGDNQRYDLVIDKGTGFKKIQVKSCSIRNGCVKAYTRSVHNTRTKSVCIVYNTKQIDAFVLYCKDNNQIYYIDAKDLADDKGDLPKGVSLRLDASKNNQTKNVKWAKDYLI
tara:strand:- start:56 stop:475 length:420 start_codon:yes stop_codon:yes gene_type:complete